MSAESVFRDLGIIGESLLEKYIKGGGITTEEGLSWYDQCEFAIKKYLKGEVAWIKLNDKERKRIENWRITSEIAEIVSSRLPYIFIAKNIIEQREIDANKSNDEKNISYSGDSIFIVHGRNHEIRDKIDSFLKNDLNLNTIVMEEGAFLGRTLPEKFEEISKNANLAIIILTADDVLRDGKKVIKRARQNVILLIPSQVRKHMIYCSHESKRWATLVT